MLGAAATAVLLAGAAMAGDHSDRDTVEHVLQMPLSKRTRRRARASTSEPTRIIQPLLIGVNVAAFFPDISLSAALSNSGSARDRSASRRNIIAQAASI